MPNWCWSTPLSLDAAGEAGQRRVRVGKGIRNLASRFKALVLSGIAAGMMLAVTPASAQDNSAAAAAPPPAATDNIGPRELSNFSLDGRVTRPAEPATPPQTAPAREQPARTAAPAEPTRIAPVPAREASAEERPAPPSRQLADRTIPEPTSQSQPTNIVASAAGAASVLPQSIPIQPVPTDSAGFSPLPWIAALLLLGAGAVIYFGRRQQKARYATSGVNRRVSEPATPDPAVRVPRPAPLPGQPLVRAAARR